MTIVLGYVPTPAGRAALDAAIVEARLRETDLVVVNTTRADRLVDPRYAQDGEVDELAATLAGSGVRHEVRRFATERLVAEELLDVVAETAAQMLVIGLRRRSPVGKLVLGSAASAVLHDSPCPVLAVKAWSAEPTP